MEVFLATATLPDSGFASLSLSTPLLAALHSASYLSPTPIQSAVIPRVLAGRDVIGQAQTGTGKTAAFLLPFLNDWDLEDASTPEPRALVLVPTRELGVQVAEEAEKLAPSSRCRAVQIVGGHRFRQQANALRRGCSVVVGTPGRVLDHLSRQTLDLSRISYVVLDEADRMLDIGFRPDIERILRRCPAQRQTLLMSATVPPPVLHIVKRYMRRPLHIKISPKRPAVDKIRQAYFTVDESRKFDLLLKLLQREDPRLCIIFCQRKRTAEQVSRELRGQTGVSRKVSAMHGDLPQSRRNDIMRRFRDGNINLLVATDLVGRGIDVTGVSHIINYDLPEDPENYVHRIGRTGRMGADGIAYAFVTPEQGKQLTAIESFTNRLLQKDSFDGFEAFTPREKEETKPAALPTFGRRTKRYSRRV